MNMHRKRWLCSVALMVGAIGLLFGACSPSTPAPAPTSTPTAAPAPLAPKPTTSPTVTPTSSPIAATKLRLTYHGTPGSALSDSVKWFVDEVNKQNSQVSIEIIWGGTLVSATESLKAVEVGTADMGVHVLGNFPDRVGMWLAGDNIAFTTPDLAEGSRIMWQLYDEFPELDKQFLDANQKVLAAWAGDNINIISKKPVRTIDDLKGMRVRAWGKAVPKELGAVGAVPVGISATEVYDALQKNTVDAALAGTETFYRYKWYESAKNLTQLNRGVTPCQYGITINLSVWKKLSPEIQQLMQKVGREQADAMAQIFAKYSEKMTNDMKAAGVTYIPFPQADRDKWKNTPGVKENRDGWIAGLEAKGLPGKKFVDRYLVLMKY